MAGAVSITRRSLFGLLAAAPVALPAVAKSNACEPYESLCANIRIDEQMGAVQPSVDVYLDGSRVAAIIDRISAGLYRIDRARRSDS
jgi:hypothetical protein